MRGHCRNPRLLCRVRRTKKDNANIRGATVIRRKKHQTKAGSMARTNWGTAKKIFLLFRMSDEHPQLIKSKKGFSDIKIDKARVKTEDPQSESGRSGTHHPSIDGKHYIQAAFYRTFRSANLTPRYGNRVLSYLSKLVKKVK